MCELYDRQQQERAQQEEAAPLPYSRHHSRYQKRFWNSLTDEEKRIRQRRIPRMSLHSVQRSAWRALFFSCNNQALITVTGLDHATFQYLLEKFRPIFDHYTPFGAVCKTTKSGRKRVVDAIDVLGLVLVWTRTRGSLMALQMSFGMTMTNLHAYLRFGRRIVVEVLKNNEHACIRVPSNEKIQQYTELIKEKFPALENVWTCMDGLKTPIQQAGSSREQEYFYNGWKHNHFVTSVFCFCPDGTVPIAHMNLPGAMHDSTIADSGDIYNKLKKVYDKTGASCCVDSAFRTRNQPYIIKSSQITFVGEGETAEEQQLDMQRKAQATSMRQSSEWGMRAIQSSFPRLGDKFPFEKRGERRISMKMIILLYNLRARLVGINQIRNFFMPALNQNAEQYM